MTTIDYTKMSDLELKKTYREKLEQLHSIGRGLNFSINHFPRIGKTNKIENLKAFNILLEVYN